MFVGRREREEEEQSDLLITLFFFISTKEAKVSSFGSISQKKEWILGFKIILRKTIRSVNKLNQREREREYRCLVVSIDLVRFALSLSLSVSVSCFCLLRLSEDQFFFCFLISRLYRIDVFSCFCRLNYFSFPNLLPEMEIAFTNAERFFSKFL